MLDEGHPCIEVEVEASASAFATRSPATSPAAESQSVGIFGAVVVVRHYVGSHVDLLRRLGRVFRWISAICIGMMFVARPVYITFVVVCVAVGALHPSRVVSQRGTVGVRRDVFSAICRYVGWGRSSF